MRSGVPRLGVVAHLRAHTESVILVTTAFLCVAYIVRTPQVPDLAAQAVRAEIVRGHGDSTWWTGWFGRPVTSDL